MHGDLNPEKTRDIVHCLNKYLADLEVEYVKLQNFHWNVTGMGFFVFHEKLEELYKVFRDEIDKIAERILMFGCKPVASLHEFLHHASIKEGPSRNINSSTISKIICDDFDKLLEDAREIVELAQENDDEYTIVLLADHIGFYEKNIWMFSSYLKR